MRVRNLCKANYLWLGRRCQRKLVSRLVLFDRWPPARAKAPGAYAEAIAFQNVMGAALKKLQALPWEYVPNVRGTFSRTRNY